MSERDKRGGERETGKERKRGDGDSKNKEKPRERARKVPNIRGAARAGRSGRL